MIKEGFFKGSIKIKTSNSSIFRWTHKNINLEYILKIRSKYVKILCLTGNFSSFDQNPDL